MFQTPSTPLFNAPESDTATVTRSSDLATVRMSRKAKKRIESMKKRRRKTMQKVFSQLLDKSDLSFTDEQLDGHDCQGRLNVKLTAAQWRRLDAAAERHDSSLYAITSALILQ